VQQSQRNGNSQIRPGPICFFDRFPITRYSNESQRLCKQKVLLYAELLPKFIIWWAHRPSRCIGNAPTPPLVPIALCLRFDLIALTLPSRAGLCPVYCNS